MGIPYVPVRGYAGSDVISRRDDFPMAPDPFNPEERFVVAKAINPDVAIFHGFQGDRAGNVLVGKRGNQTLLAQASRRCIVTVEEIVDKVDPDDPRGTFLPAIHVTAVVHAPKGAHPTACPGYYDMDERQIREYMEASVSDEALAAYLDKYIFAFKSHEEYLEALGLTPARAKAGV